MASKSQLKELLSLYRERGPDPELDPLLRRFYDNRLELLQTHLKDAPFQIFLSGSYGRGKPSPFSDVDLIFLMEDTDRPEKFEPWVNTKIYPLYEFFPVVEYSFRRKKDLEKSLSEDFRVFYSLKEARHLETGKPFPLPSSAKPMDDELFTHIRKRWDQYSNSPCLVELNVKESPGALIDIENYQRRLGTMTDDMRDAEMWCLRFRAFFHAMYGKKKDVASFTIMRQLNPRWIRELYRATTHVYLKMWSLIDPRDALIEVHSLKEWCEVATLSKRKFNAHYLSGSFSRILPEMSEQLYTCSASGIHKFTVGWHSSECLKVVKDLLAMMVNPAPLGLTKALSFIDQPDTLNLAVFLHDMGKGHPGDHSQWGSEWVRKSAIFEGSKLDQELIAWLIQHHLDLHERAMKNDILSDKFIEQTMKWAGTARRWSYLYLLTVTDLIATNKSLWTSWRAQLLGKYYLRVMDRFGQGEIEFCNVQQPEHLNKEEGAFFASMPLEYRLTRLSSQVPVDYRLSQDMVMQGSPALVIEFDDSLGFDVLAVASRLDLTESFQAILKILFGAHIGVWRCRSYPLQDGFLNLFWIYPYGAAHLRLTKSRNQSLSRSIAKAFSNPPSRKNSDASLDLLVELESKTGSHCQLQEIEEGRVWDLNVNAPDRDGLLHDIVDVIFRAGYSIQSATIGTTGDRALDHFTLSRRNS